MPTVDTDLDWVQTRLHDSGTLWPRSELLNWWNDGYRELLARSRAMRRLRPLDLPGRHTYAATQEWEDRHTTGTMRKPSRAATSERYQTSGLWEIESLGGVTPTAALAGYTHEWERAHLSGAVDHHFRFAFPKNHERVVRLEWKNRALFPVSVRELDQTDTTWMSQIGEPRWWTLGAGRVRTVELYEVTSTYGQAYHLIDAENGLPRGFNVPVAAPESVVTTVTGSSGGGGIFGLAALIFGSSGSSTSVTTTTPGVPIERSSARSRDSAVKPESIPNAYGYTSQGDAQALGHFGTDFGPATCYIHTWEADADIAGLYTQPAFNFGINLTMLYPGLERVTVHPHELGPAGGPSIASDATLPGKRGMFPWERLDPDGNYATTAHHPDEPIALTGLGLRCTVQALTMGTYFGTQPWEADDLDNEATLRTGLVRGTYTWEEPFTGVPVILGIGAIRGVTSPDRQYMPVFADAQPVSLSGRITDWRSSEDSLMAVEIVVPDQALLEDDVPALIPPQMQKYLRYYVLARAWGRVGEGRQPQLADHCAKRFLAGATFFRRFTDLAFKDRVYAREQAVSGERYTPPRVRLPSNYPAVF